MIVFLLEVGLDAGMKSGQADGPANIAIRFPFLLDHDPVQLYRIMVYILHWSMIFSENRIPLFWIML